MMGRVEPIQPRLGAAPRTRAVCAIMRIETREGYDEELEGLLNDLAHMVRADEPGCESYIVTRAMGSRSHFAIHTRFADWLAFEHHAETAHLTRLMPRLTALMAAPMAMEIFLEA
jgi:quinol monooxygenase YgiN